MLKETTHSIKATIKALEVEAEDLRAELRNQKRLGLVARKPFHIKKGDIIYLPYRSTLKYLRVVGKVKAKACGLIRYQFNCQSLSGDTTETLYRFSDTLSWIKT